VPPGPGHGVIGLAAAYAGSPRLLSQKSKLVRGNSASTSPWATSTSLLFDRCDNCFNSTNACTAPAPIVLSPKEFGGIVGARPGGFAAHCGFEPWPHDILLIGDELAAPLTNYRKA